MQSISFRRAQPKDFPVIKELFDLSVEEDINRGECSPNTIEFQQWLNEIFYIAEVKSHVVGLLIATEVVHSITLGIIPSNTRVIHLEELYVHPDYRNRRIGSKFLSKLFSEAEKRAVGHFLLYSATKDW